jgi:hypothetical protein
LLNELHVSAEWEPILLGHLGIAVPQRRPWRSLARGAMGIASARLLTIVTFLAIP